MMHQEFSYESPYIVAAAAAASPDFKSGNKRGVNKLKILKKKIIRKAAVFNRKQNKKARKKARKAAKQKIQEFSNENPSSNDTSSKLSKTVTARNIPCAIQKSVISLFFKQAGEVVNSWCDERVEECRHIEFATEEAAKKALELDGQIFGNRKILVDRYGTTTGASKTLIAKHLSFSIAKSDVIKFFKRFGEIIDVRFSSLDHEKCSKHCHIEFATEEGAKKAAEYNGERWLGHLLELGFAREIIHVWGIDTSIEFEEIHGILGKIFSKNCGTILWMEIPTAPYTNITLGEAFIEFYDIRDFPKALAMNGHKFGEFYTIKDLPKALARTGRILGNSTLRVEDATPRRLRVEQPGPRTKIGGRPVGPYVSSLYRPSRFFPHRGWYGQGIGRRGGGILANAFIAGKKTIFDDDGEKTIVDKRSAVRDAVPKVSTLSVEDDVHRTGKEIISDGRKVDESSTLRVEDSVPKVHKSSTLRVEDAVPKVHKSSTLRVENAAQLQLDGAGIGKHDVHRTVAGKKTIFDDEGRKVDTAHDDGAGIGKHVHRTGKKKIFDDDCPEGREVDKRSTLGVEDAVPKVDEDAVPKVDEDAVPKVDESSTLRKGKKRIYDDDCPDGRIVDTAQDDGAGIGKHGVYHRPCSIHKLAWVRLVESTRCRSKV